MPVSRRFTSFRNAAVLRRVVPHRRQWLVCVCAVLGLVFLVPAEAQAQADLALTKSVSNATPNVGDIVTFTIVLTNNGPSATALGVVVTDLLPPGLTFAVAAPSQGTYDSASGLWNVGTLSTGLPQTLIVSATVTTPNAQTNTATITASSQADPNTNNNSASVTVTPQLADVGVTKIVSNTTPLVGDTIIFTITLTNAGPSTATGVAVTDLLPAGLSFVSATPSQGTYTSLSGLWNVGTLTTATPQTLAIVATVASPNSQTNTAIISDSDQFDPSSGNNAASATLTPQAPGGTADLALAKSVSNATPNVGSPVTFTVTLTNNGPATATGVTVTDLLPAGLTFVSATPSQGTYTSATGVWNVGTITTASPQTLGIVATVVSAAALSNTATITASGQADPNAGNNTASVTVTPPQANLSVAKTVNNATPNVGSNITFTITLTNNGPATATGVVLTDLLPAGLTFVSATPSQGSYASATGVWTVGTVTTATPQTLGIVATVVGPTAISNTATITSSNQFDPVAANNTATVTVTPPAAVPTLPTVVLVLLMGALAGLAVRSLHVRRGVGGGA